jgi:hypothetical protein
VLLVYVPVAGGRPPASILAGEDNVFEHAFHAVGALGKREGARVAHLLR